MPESFMVIIIKKYLWELVLLATCLSMFHQSIDNFWGDARWVWIAKWIVNWIYASVFFGGIGGYMFQEAGLVGWIIVWGLVGIATARDLALLFLAKMSQKDRP